MVLGKYLLLPININRQLVLQLFIELFLVNSCFLMDWYTELGEIGAMETKIYCLI